MRLALDSNAYIDLARGNRHVLFLVENAEFVYMPFAVVAELRAGFTRHSLPRDNEKALASFLAKSFVEVLYPDDRTTRQYALLYQQIRAKGTPIPQNDLWIAALVVQHGLTLCTRDLHFDAFPQIARV